MYLDSIQDIKDVLRSKIFVSGDNISFVFDDDAFAKLDGDMRFLIRRSNIEWKNISPKYRYSIAQQGLYFIFKTFENEISPTENEFVISIARKDSDMFTMTLQPLQDEKGSLSLHSD